MAQSPSDKFEIGVPGYGMTSSYTFDTPGKHPGSDALARLAIEHAKKMADAGLASDADLAAAEHGEQDRCDTDFTTTTEPLLTIQQRENEEKDEN